MCADSQEIASGWSISVPYREKRNRAFCAGKSKSKSKSKSTFKI